MPKGEQRNTFEKKEKLFTPAEEFNTTNNISYNKKSSNSISNMNNMKNENNCKENAALYP